jgi:hypothetical protein
MIRRAALAVVAVPALWQLGLLVWAIWHRLPYPYDLEWMEGGLLNHAQRLADGQPLYAPPSVDFIPYLYTPLYPALLAALGRLVGLGYVLGRVVSVVSLAAVLAVGAVEILRARRDLAWVGAAFFGGFVAATYPWVEGWYDLVRGDTLFLALATAGLAVLRAGARRPLWVVGAAALLALAFFAKQTGVLVVAAGGAALLVLNWRLVPLYVAVAGIIGGGGSWLLNRATSGWYWTYIFGVHQQHDTNLRRFGQSFLYQFGHFPALTALVVGACVAILVVRIRTGRRPDGAGPFLFWAAMFGFGSVIGALGWATQWAHWNAYIPAMTFGALAAGAALVPLADCFAGIAGRVVLGLALVGPAVQLGLARWSPTPFIPTAADRAAGAALIARLAAIPGDLFVPSHPWYARLAGKPRTTTHRMGILDMTYGGGTVAGLADALKRGRFAAVVLDDRTQLWELPGLTEGYRMDEIIAAAPRVVTGAPTRPRTIWVPAAEPPPPRGTRVDFDFESPYAGWTVTGTAWGKGPVREVPGKEVVGFRGHAFASSATGGDRATGTLVSPPFTIAGTQLTLRVGGGNGKGVRVELRAADTGQVLRTATGARTTTLALVAWSTADLRGRSVRLACVDEDTGPWGVLWVDDVRESGL